LNFPSIGILGKDPNYHLVFSKDILETPKRFVRYMGLNKRFITQGENENANRKRRNQGAIPPFDASLKDLATT
jgi:hypothetical protein